MNKIKKILSFVALTSVMSVLVTACGSTSTSSTSTEKMPQSATSDSSQGKITLRVAWWGTPVRNERTLKVIKMFEQKYPNITIKPEYTGWNGYWQRLATQAAGHSLPDVIQMDYSYLNQYVDDNLLVNLNPYEKNNTLNLQNVSSSYLVGGEVNGKLYAVNLGANAPSIGMDSSLLNKIGITPLKPGYTYDDFAKVAKEVKQKLGKGHYGTEPYDGINDFTYYLRQKGLTLYNKQGNGLGYSDDQLLTDFFTYWQNMVKSGVAAPPNVTLAVNNIQDELIVHGTEPFIDFFSNQAVAVKSSMQDQLTLLPLPTMPGGKEGEYLKPSQFFSVTDDSKHQKAAVEWINYFTNSVAANKVLDAERGVPISTVVRKALYQNLAPGMKDEFDFVSYVGQHSTPINPPDPKNAGKVSTIWKNISEEVNYLKITPSEAAKQFRQQATQALQS